MNLEGNLLEKMGLITKSHCMSITDLNQIVTYICHVVDVCSNLQNDFHVYCLFNMSDQFVLELILVASDWKATKTQFCFTA